MTNAVIGVAMAQTQTEILENDNTQESGLENAGYAENDSEPSDTQESNEEPIKIDPSWTTSENHQGGPLTWRLAELHRWSITRLSLIYDIVEIGLRPLGASYGLAPKDDSENNQEIPDYDEAYTDEYESEEWYEAPGSHASSPEWATMSFNERQQLDGRWYRNHDPNQNGWKATTRSAIWCEVWDGSEMVCRRRSKQWAKQPDQIGRRAAKRREREQKLEARRREAESWRKVISNPAWRADLHLTAHHYNVSLTEALTFFAL